MNEDIPLARREAIAARLAQGQPVVATALAIEYDISEDAIRRDLRALAAQGRCRRVYGGALPIAPGSVPMAARLDEGRAQKAALARAAVTLIEPGELLFLDSGSTNLALVELLPEDRELTVATNSIDIAAAVLRRSDLQLIVIGGTVDHMVGGCIDASAVQAVAQFAFDRCFLGACALSPKTGVGAASVADATFKRAALAASRNSVALATADKFAAHAPYRVAPIKAIGHVVVEYEVSDAQCASLWKAGTSVVKAERPDSE